MDVFRLLVRHAPDGLTPGEMTARLSLPAPTLSFHLAQLSQAGLLTVRKEGRSRRYAPDFAAVRGLVDFLMKDCCAGACTAPALEKECTR